MFNCFFQKASSSSSFGSSSIFSRWSALQVSPDWSLSFVLLDSPPPLRLLGFGSLLCFAFSFFLWHGFLQFYNWSKDIFLEKNTQDVSNYYSHKKDALFTTSSSFKRPHRWSSSAISSWQTAAMVTHLLLLLSSLDLALICEKPLSLLYLFVPPVLSLSWVGPGGQKPKPTPK